MEKQEFSIEWQGIALFVTYTPHWLSFMSHIEVRADEPLPITQTGYRSVFLNKEEIDHAGGVVTLVTDLLKQATTSKYWQDQNQKRKQLSLF